MIFDIGKFYNLTKAGGIVIKQYYVGHVYTATRTDRIAAKFKTYSFYAATIALKTINF